MQAKDLQVGDVIHLEPNSAWWDPWSDSDVVIGAVGPNGPAIIEADGEQIFITDEPSHPWKFVRSAHVPEPTMAAPLVSAQDAFADDWRAENAQLRVQNEALRNEILSRNVIIRANGTAMVVQEKDSERTIRDLQMKLTAAQESLAEAQKNMMKILTAATSPPKDAEGK